MEYVALRNHGGGVVVLSADRPPANAMDVGLLGELVEAVERLAHEVPRALVLTGRPGFFSAGADLKAVPGYGPEQQGFGLNIAGDSRGSPPGFFAPFLRENENGKKGFPDHSPHRNLTDLFEAIS